MLSIKRQRPRKAAEVKTCTKCRTEKEVSEFYNDKNRKDGLNPYCKTCIKEYQDVRKDQKAEYDKAYYEQTKDKYKETRREQADEWRDSNRDRTNELTRLRRHADPEKTREENRRWYRANAEKKREKKRAWNKTPAGRASSKNQWHRRRSLTRETDIAAQWLLQLKTATIHCTLCGTKMTTHNHHLPTHKELDHILPLCAGGNHTMDNVRYTCKRCNGTRPRDGSDVS